MPRIYNIVSLFFLLQAVSIAQTEETSLIPSEELFVDQPFLYEHFDNFFKKGRLVLLGECHDDLDPKVLLHRTAMKLIDEKKIDTIAIEYGNRDAQSVMDKYLKDPRATKGSSKEAFYLCKINRFTGSNIGKKMSMPFSKFKNLYEKRGRKSALREQCGGNFSGILFNNKFLSLLQSAKKRKVRICLVDGLETWNHPSAPKGRDMTDAEYKAVSKKQMMDRLNGKILELATRDSKKIENISPREYEIAQNIINCFSGARKGFALVGINHAHTPKAEVAKFKNSGRILKDQLGSSMQSVIYACSHDKESRLYNNCLNVDKTLTSRKLVKYSNIINQIPQDCGFQKYGDWMEYVVIGPNIHGIEKKYFSFDSK